MKIFMTGATGFLGRRVVKRLLKEGHDLTLLVRTIPEDPLYHQDTIDLVKGDLKNVATWEPALVGQDLVIHLAAPVVFWGEWNLYQEGIVDATIHLYQAANRWGVKRFIYISSESVLQDKSDLLDIDETNPYPQEPSSYYGKAKKLAEESLLAMVDKTEVVILRPTFIWGTGVAALDTFVEKVQSGQFVWIDKGQVMIEMVHVDNVAEAIALACTGGKTGEIYFVTDGQARSVKEFLTDLLATRGVKIPEKSLPSWFVKPLASLIETTWRIFHLTSQPPLTRFDLSFIAMNRRYAISKIKHDMGYRSVIDYRQAMEVMRKDWEDEIRQERGAD